MKYNLDELGKYYAKWKKKPDTEQKTNVWFHLYEVPRVIKFIDTESRTVAASIWKERQVTADGYGVSVLQNEKVLESAQQCNILNTIEF